MNGELAEDSDLIARSRNGDTAAFDELITRYRTKVYMVTHSIVRNPEEALDLTQETFIRAWKSLARFDGGSLGSWLGRIARNLSIDMVRRKQARPQSEIDVGPMRIDAASRTTPSSPEKPGEGMDRGHIRERFEQALAKLSIEHRETIILKEIEDLSYKEIAEQTGCSIGTVMSRLFYARKKLQAELRDLYEQL